jgi:signal transduction histidine kinase
LDSAYTHGLLTNNPAFFANNIMCQKAYVFFDTNKYGAADSLMKRLAANNYQFIDEEGKSKLFMQEAYLMYLNKDYKKAEARYKVALSKMEIASACDRPMIYGKLIELYAAMKEIVKLYSAYEKAVVVADSCGIVKYKLYATELMAGTLANIGAYKEAVFYNKLKDSLESVYDYKSYQDTLDQLQLKRLSELKERQISVQQENLRTKNLQIGLLIVSLIAVFIVWMYYELQQRQKRILQDKKNSQRFTVQLLQKTEDDRKHIAGHLHDGINHELLTVKNMINDADKETLKQRIDLLIEDVRQISHHLHPVVFSKVRLAHSITQLVDRVQKMNNFMLSAEVDYNKGLPLESELQLYRILQEAVTNMIKHSNAVAGKITLTQQVDAVVIDIKDNGKGFNVEDKLNSDKAFGLHNIIERSRAAGGDATIRSDENGTYIQIKIPLQ